MEGSSHRSHGGKVVCGVSHRLGGAGGMGVAAHASVEPVIGKSFVEEGTAQCSPQNVHCGLLIFANKVIGWGQATFFHTFLILLVGAQHSQTHGQRG